MNLEGLCKCYVYRYIYNNDIIYIGKTNDLNRRNKEHKCDKWYTDKLKYEYIEVRNEFFAKLYEEYLINRDCPKANIASKKNYNVDDIKFNVEEIWKPVILNERNNREVFQQYNDKSIKKTNRELVRDIQIQDIDNKFMELISKDKKKIIKIYYDEHGFLTVILKCPKLEELLNSKYMPSCTIGLTFNKNSGIVVIEFNKAENLEGIYREKYNKFCELLDINQLNLDRDYGKRAFNDGIDLIEKKYIALIDNKYEITLVRIKDDFEVSIPIDDVIKLFGGLTVAYRLPFALGLKYKDNKNILLIHYESVRYNEIFNQELKEKFKYQYYIKSNHDKELLEYLLYKKRIPNKMLSGYREYDEEVGVFYQRRENVIKFDISDNIIQCSCKE
jgi:hypothetical protein